MLAHFRSRYVRGLSYDMEAGFDPVRTQSLSWGLAAQYSVSMAPPGAHLRNMQLEVLFWLPLSPRLSSLCELVR